MTEDEEFSKLREYISDLKIIKSEILKTLDECDEKKISQAAKHYPERLNHLLMKRNIKSVSVLFPFFDLPILQERAKDIDLIDLNIKNNNIDLLEEVFRRIDQEFEELQ